MIVRKSMKNNIIINETFIYAGSTDQVSYVLNAHWYRQCFLIDIIIVNIRLTLR